MRHALHLTVAVFAAACGGSSSDPDSAPIVDSARLADASPADATPPIVDAPRVVPDAGPPDGVPIACRPTPVCSGDLSGIGTADFTIAFTINMTATASSAVIAQRAVCSHSFMWSVRTGGGASSVLGFEYDDNNAHYRSFSSSRPINDGVDHAVLACRVSGTDYLYIDGVLDVTGPNVVDFSTTLSPLEIGTSPCVAFGDGTQDLVGTVDDVCVGTP